MRIQKCATYVALPLLVVSILSWTAWVSAQDSRTARPTSPSRTASNAPSNSAAPATTKSTQYLPYEDGQKWMEYDIRPYTSRFPDREHPEQDIVDWVLRDTGTEMWFSQPLGFMSASREKLRVYHVPEVQKKVKALVERFVQEPAATYVLGVRVMTVGSPNWRSRALNIMRPVPVQSPGVDAWLLSKENAALLVAQLRKRTDFAEHITPNVAVSNGEVQLIERRMTRSYQRSLQFLANSVPNYRVEPGSLEEGYSLEISPLLSVDGRIIEAAIKCQMDQVEKFIPVQIEIPATYGQTQRAQVEVPQVASWRLHERFRWPSDQVLVLSCGVVASPQGERASMGLPLPIGNQAARADALLVLECRAKGAQIAAPAPRAAASQPSPGFTRGRY